MTRLGNVLLACVIGVLSAAAGHLAAFGCAEGIAHELLGASIPTLNFVYGAGEGLVTAAAIVGLVIVSGRFSQGAAILIGGLSTVVCALIVPWVGLLLHNEVTLATTMLANLILLSGLSLMILRRKDTGPLQNSKPAASHPIGT